MNKNFLCATILIDKIIILINGAFMKNFFKRAISTLLIVGSLAGFSSTQMQVSNEPVKIVDSIPEENLETDVGNLTQSSTNSQISTEITDNLINTQEEIAKYYSSREQIETIMDALDANNDNAYFVGITGNKTVVKFEHKIGEPLKVAVQPNMSENAASIIF